MANEPIELGDLVVDTVGHEVRYGGHRIRLTYLEFHLLRILVQHGGRVLTRDELLARVWGNRSVYSGRTVDIHMSRLRRKLGAPLSGMLETVWKVGYKCALPRSQAELHGGAAALGGRPAA